MPKFSFVGFIFWVRICQVMYFCKGIAEKQVIFFSKMLFGCHPMWSHSFLLLISISFSELYLVFFFFFWIIFFINSFWFWYHFFFLQIFVSTGLGVNVNFLGWRIFQIGLSVACKLFDLYCLFYYDCCLGCTIVFFWFFLFVSRGQERGTPELYQRSISTLL